MILGMTALLCCLVVLPFASEQESFPHAATVRVLGNTNYGGSRDNARVGWMDYFNAEVQGRQRGKLEVGSCAVFHILRVSHEISRDELVHDDSAVQVQDALQR